MTLTTYHFSFSITGADGAAASPPITFTSGNLSTHPISGELQAIYVKYGTQPTTTDVTIATKGDNGPAQNLLVLTNKNTSGWFYPRVALVDTTGTAITYDGTHADYDELVLDDYVTVTVAQGNAGAIDVWLIWEY